jgi:2',3'-cyclic-nucleotide 2'-phosphodiesterase (5'-nucleotidase family)
VDAFTLGNHEFDAGLASLATYLTSLNASGIPVL